MSNSLRPYGLEPTRLLCPWNSPGKNSGMGCHSLLQGFFLTQGLNLGLLHCRQIRYHLSYQGSPIFILILLFFFNFIKLKDFVVSKIWKEYMFLVEMVLC